MADFLAAFLAGAFLVDFFAAFLAVDFFAAAIGVWAPRRVPAGVDGVAAKTTVSGPTGEGCPPTTSDGRDGVEGTRVADTAWRTEDLDPAAAAWAMSPAGRPHLLTLLDVELDDALGVASRLRAAGLSPPRAAAIQGIATASRRARAAGHPDHSWWTPAAAEQASDPEVGAWRARRYAGAPTVDLTAGCGGDALALVPRVDTLVANERDAARLPLLAANLAGQALVVRGDATAPCLRTADRWAWADPGRRVAGRRVRGLGNTLPPVPALLDAGWAGLGVAVSPALALDDPDRPAGGELEFVQVGRRLVEATLWMGAATDTAPGPRATASATLLPGGEHVRGEPTAPLPTTTPLEVGAWLAEPAPALVRARLVDRVARELGFGRVARRRALFTGSEPTSSPWFRLERVEAVVAARPRRVRDVLAGLDPLPVELLVHGLDADLRGWWRGLGHPERGPHGRAVHLIRLDGRGVAVVTRRAA